MNPDFSQYVRYEAETGALVWAINRRLNKKGRFGLDGLVSHRGGYSVYCAGKYIKWTKDFFDACCIRKSEERRNGYHINNGRAA